MTKIKVIKDEVPESVSYENYKELIEKYKIQNPKKYELKKERLLAKLASLK